MANRNETHPIPEPEGSDPKEVFAFFGLACYNAQILEQCLINLAVGLSIRGLTKLTREEIDRAWDRADKHTLGRLLNEVRTHAKVPVEVEAAIAKAVTDRNFLCHRFFAEHDIDFACDPGRKRMLLELREMIARFISCDALVEPICLSLWDTLGVTQTQIDAWIRQAEDEVVRREQTG